MQKGTLYFFEKNQRQPRVPPFLPVFTSFMKDTSSTVFISFFSFAHCLVSLNITSF